MRYLLLLLALSFVRPAWAQTACDALIVESPLSGDECIAVKTLAGKARRTNPDAIAGLVTIPAHNDLSGLQGGTGSQYYHLTAAEYTELQVGYIEKNGTTTTTAQIPFAEGISLPSNKEIFFGGTSSANADGGIIGNSDILYIRGYPNTVNGTTVKITGGDAPFQGSAGFVRLHAGAPDIGGDTPTFAFVTTDQTITGFTFGSNIAGASTLGNTIEDFSVGGMFYGAGSSAFAGGLGLYDKLATSGYSILTTGASAQIIGMDRANSGAGQNLTVQAGWAQSSGTDLAAGNLILAPGKATGSRSGNTQLQAVGGLGSGTTDRTPSTIVTVAHDGVTTVQNSIISKATPSLVLTDSGGDDYNMIVTAGVLGINNTTDSRNIIGSTAAGVITVGSTASGTSLVSNTASGGTQAFQLNSVEYLNIGATNIVLNETGTATNIRIESDTDANNLFSDGTNNRVGIGRNNPSKKLGVDGDIALETAGNGLYVKEGTNATMGTATLSAGTVVVSTTKVTANSRIFLTTQGGTLTNVGAPYISARTAGTSFTITSTNILDASNVAWVIIEPA